MADTAHFGSRQVPLADKQALVDDVFRSVARRYDLMNDLSLIHISGTPALAIDASKPAAPAAAQSVAAKKKPHVAARHGKEDTDPLAEVPSFSAEAVGWRLVEDPATGARLGPVSYTHLDVYKRQVESSAWEAHHARSCRELRNRCRNVRPLRRDHDRGAADKTFANRRPDGVL